MPRISVLLPTRDHAATLPWAVRSVQQQGVDDLEILICGDGATDAVRATVARLGHDDPRIRFFDLPKAPARGELNRDRVMREARGRIICHQNDDDLWLPGHVETLERALDDADFVGAIQVNVGTDDRVRAYYFDLERSEFVAPWLAWTPNAFGAWACNGFGPIFAAHTRDAFLRLPEGWTTTPEGLPADQHFWHKFLRQPWCRVRFLRWPIALHFAAPDRLDWSEARRAEELQRWTAIIESPGHAARIWRNLLPELGDRLLSQSLEAAAERAAVANALAVERTERVAIQNALAGERAERAAVENALAGERAARAEAERTLEALLASRSWRITAPLRRAATWLGRRLKSGSS